MLAPQKVIILQLAVASASISKSPHPHSPALGGLVAGPRLVLVILMDRNRTWKVLILILQL